MRSANTTPMFKATAVGRMTSGRWSVGVRTRGLSAGDRVFLLRQRTDRGIVASGYLSDGSIFEAPHWAKPHRLSRYAYVTWDLLFRSQTGFRSSICYSRCLVMTGTTFTL